MATEAAEMFYLKEVNAGERFRVEFWLVGNHRKAAKLEERLKSMTWIKSSEFRSNYYTIKGEVIEVWEHPSLADSNLAVLDCGLYVFTQITKTAPLKVGDYLQLEGRLDAHIVGKVN